MIIDLIICGVLLLGLGIGLGRGLVAPLFTEGSLFIALFVVTHVPFSLDSVPGPVRFGIGAAAVFAIGMLIRMLAGPLVALLERLPFIRTINTVAGAVVHTLLAFILMYVTLGVLLDFDRNLYPMLSSGVATARQIQDLRDQVKRDPALRTSVDDKKLQQQQQSAGSGSVPFNALARAEGFLDFYIREVRGPLVDSKLAPIVNSVGKDLPFVGHPRPYLTAPAR